MANSVSDGCTLRPEVWRTDWSRVVAEICASALLLGLHCREISQAQMESSPEYQHLELFFLQPGQ